MVQVHTHTHTVHPSLQQTRIANLQHKFFFLSLASWQRFLARFLLANCPHMLGIYHSAGLSMLPDLLTMQLASCSLPNRGLMNGAICRQRNVCTDTGKPRSCSPSSWSMSKSSLLLFGVWLLLFACRLLLFVVVVVPVVAAVALVTMVASCEVKRKQKQSTTRRSVGTCNKSWRGVEWSHS